MTAGIVPSAEAGEEGAEIDRALDGAQDRMMHPLLIRAIRYGLIGFGALTIVSAAINVIGARMLIEVSDEAQLGFTRNEFMLWYVGPAILGVTMIVFGALWRRKG